MTSQKLSNAQLELLKMFAYDLSEAELSEMKAVLAKHFAQKLTQQMDELWEENNWSQETMDTWASEHMRTPYKDPMP